MTPLIDIQARVFGEDDSAYRVFPGGSYRHYEAMHEHGLVFLDFPAIPFPATDGFKETDDIREAIVRAELYASVVYRNSDNVPELMAEISSRDLTKTRWSKRRKLALSQLNGLYNEMKIGDLVVVPAPLNSFTKEEAPRTLVGEVVSDVERWTEPTEKYQKAALLVRRVKWLSEVDERDLDVRTLRALRTQNALVRLPADSLRPVLGAAYQNVIIDGEFLARFTTAGEDFTARESYHFQAFVLAIVEAFRAKGDAEAAELAESIYAIAASVRRGEATVPEQEFSIHSPGYTTLRGKSVVFVIASLFSLALSAHAEPFDETGAARVGLENSASKRYDPCAPEGLADEVVKTLDALGMHRWKEACSAATAASEDEGFAPKASVK
ncbi:hypothetical protein GCM10011415_27890 [Salipiger pallidus]|uniref:Uncharacterized protein n=1 Tax=Salipiger pallidus TaxID=1775170 RepID=A0A8J2ZLH5_9RHOB|nr:hypothetical protein [Salipiger pallidus]GGG77413.1 hypothetical protein GCM10011415_27890 [Salipiger pallidus]